MKQVVGHRDTWEKASQAESTSSAKNLTQKRFWITEVGAGVGSEGIMQRGQGQVSRREMGSSRSFFG